MMNEILSLVLAGVTGLLLGTMFFGSLLLRTSIVLTGFTFIARGHWEPLLLCIVGFAIARFIVIRHTGPPVEHYNSPAKEAGHAS